MSLSWRNDLLLHFEQNNIIFLTFVKDIISNLACYCLSLFPVVLNVRCVSFINICQQYLEDWHVLEVIQDEIWTWRWLPVTSAYFGKVFKRHSGTSQSPIKTPGRMTNKYYNDKYVTMFESEPKNYWYCVCLCVC